MTKGALSLAVDCVAHAANAALISTSMTLSSQGDGLTLIRGMVEGFMTRRLQ